MKPVLDRLVDELPPDPPQPSEARTPVHVVYGGAHLFKPETPDKLANIALKTLATHGDALALDPLVHARVQAKLTREAVEDFRIDFEDGYGVRSAEEEDHDAVAAAAAITAAAKLPPFIGLRTKPFRRATAARALRTLELFAQTLSRALTKPKQLRLTLPKVSDAREVATAANALSLIERDYDLRFELELMIETKGALVKDGAFNVPALVNAGEGRVGSVHFGAYDYLSAHDVAASEQRLDHPLCDRAREILQLTSPVRVVDGATTLLPVTPEVAVEALRLHATNIRRALGIGIYQGWDLHPAQLVARYAAVYSFFLAQRDAAAARLQRFLADGAKAREHGGVFDDAATALGLVSFFLRGYYCGAFDEKDIALTGKTVRALETRSFAALIV